MWEPVIPLGELMRVRTNDKFSGVDAFFRQYDQASNLVTSIDRTSAALVGESQTTYDVLTPHYGKRKAAGEIIINPFISSHLSRQNTFGGPSIRLNTANPNVWNDYHWTGPYLSFWMNSSDQAIPPDIVSKAEVNKLISIASTKCWGAVSDSKVQLLQTLADIKRTIELVMHPLDGTLSFLRKARSRKNSSARDRSMILAKYMAREWLTYRYGWRQLYLDTKGVLDAVGTKERTGLLQARGTSKTRAEANDTLLVKANSSTFNIEVNRTIVDEVYVKCGLFYDGKLDVPKYLGLTYLDVLAAAWDIIPYSFVVDWVVNVQGYLSALTPFLLVPSKGSYTVVTRVKSMTHQATGNVNMLNSTWIQYAGVTSPPVGISFTLSRDKKRYVGVENPSLSLVASIGDLTPTRVTDALALIVNTLGRT